jgi:hypothetical protein
MKKRKTLRKTIQRSRFLKRRRSWTRWDLFGE